MRYCGKCGSKVSDTAAFCGKCGCKLRPVEPSYEPGSYYYNNNQQRNAHYNNTNATIITAVIASLIVIAILTTFVYFTTYKQIPKITTSSSENHQNNSTNVNLQKETDDLPINTAAPNSSDIENCYIKTFESFLPIDKALPRDLLYAVYDIDKNSVPELIIKDHYSETQTTYNIYSYNGNDASYIGNYDATHSAIYNYNGNGIVYFSAQGGYGVMKLFSIENDNLYIDQSIDITPYNYCEPGDLFDGANSMITLHSYHDEPELYKNYIHQDIEKYLLEKCVENNQKQSLSSDLLEGDIDNYINAYIRPLYNEINSNLNNYTITAAKGITYWSNGKGYVKKSFEADANGMAREYYYNTTDGQIFFAFLFKSNIEHRLYFRDNKLIRYIGPNGNIDNNPISEEILDMGQSVVDEAYL